MGILVNSATSSKSGSIIIQPQCYTSVLAGTFANSNEAGHTYTHFTNTSSAQNDGLRYRVYLTPGTYTIRINHWRHTNRAIVDCKLGLTTSTVSVGTADLYNAVTSAWGEAEVSGVSISSSGLYYFDIVCSDKNAGSSSYCMALAQIIFYKTAE